MLPDAPRGSQSPGLQLSEIIGWSTNSWLEFQHMIPQVCLRLAYGSRQSMCLQVSETRGLSTNSSLEFQHSMLCKPYICLPLCLSLSLSVSLSPRLPPGGSQRLQESPRVSQRLPEVPGGSQGLPEAGPSQRLPEAPRCSQMLPEAPRALVYNCRKSLVGQQTLGLSFNT